MSMKNFCFFLKPNSFLIDKISCQGVKKLASTRKKTKFLVVISLRMQIFPITTIRFKNPAKISQLCTLRIPLLTHAQTNVPSVVQFYSLSSIIYLEIGLSPKKCGKKHGGFPFSFIGFIAISSFLFKIQGGVNYVPTST